MAQIAYEKLRVTRCQDIKLYEDNSEKYVVLWRWQKSIALFEEETSDSDDLEHLVRPAIFRIVVESTEHEDYVTVFEMKMSMETKSAMSR